MSLVSGGGEGLMHFRSFLTGGHITGVRGQVALVKETGRHCARRVSKFSRHPRT